MGSHRRGRPPNSPARSTERKIAYLPQIGCCWGAAASGGRLTAFSASGGLRSVGIASVASYALTDNVFLLANARYDRLVGDAGDSPIVKAGDADRVGELFSYDAVFEDMALRTQLRGRAAIVRYLRRALPGLPYARASVRHVAGAGQGGGYEWRADGQLVAVGAAALELSPDGKITKFTVTWDGSLLDDRAITALAADAVDR